MYNSSLHFTCPSCGIQSLGVGLSLPTYMPANMTIQCSDPSCGTYWNVKWEINPVADPSV